MRHLFSALIVLLPLSAALVTKVAGGPDALMLGAFFWTLGVHFVGTADGIHFVHSRWVLEKRREG